MCEVISRNVKNIAKKRSLWGIEYRKGEWSRLFFTERDLGKWGMAEVRYAHQLQHEPSYVKLSKKK